MKNLIIAILSVSLLSFTGCCVTKKKAPVAVKSTPAVTTNRNVERAMKSYQRALLTHKVNDQQKARVNDLYNRYTQAFEKAQNSKVNMDKDTPKEVADSAERLIKAVNGLAK